MEGKFYEVKGKEVYYKSEGFTIADAAKLATLYDESGNLSGFVADFNSTFFQFFEDQWRIFDTAKINQLLLSYMGQEDQAEGLEENVKLFGSLISEGKTKQDDKIGSWVKKVIEETSVLSATQQESGDDFKQELIVQLDKQVDRFLKIKLNDLMVKEAIASKGVTVQKGGARAWDEDEGNIPPRVMKTATELGIKYSATHFETANFDLEERHKRASLYGYSEFNAQDVASLGARLGIPHPLDQVQILPEDFEQKIRFMGSLQQEEGFKWTKFAFDIGSLAGNLDPKTRRFAYASRKLVARAA